MNSSKIIEKALLNERFSKFMNAYASRPLSDKLSVEVITLCASFFQYDPTNGKIALSDLTQKLLSEKQIQTITDIQNQIKEDKTLKRKFEIYVKGAHKVKEVMRYAMGKWEQEKLKANKEEDTKNIDGDK